MSISEICHFNELNPLNNLPIDPISYEDILLKDIIDIDGRCYSNTTIESLIESCLKNKTPIVDPFTRKLLPEHILSFYMDKHFNYSNYHLSTVPRLNINILSLDISKNYIKDISSLNVIINVESLNISSNKIKDIQVLINLTKLKELNMSSNLIENIPLLSDKLEILIANNNRIVKIESIKDLKNLTILKLHSNSIEDLNPISNLTRIHTLTLSRNNIKEISSLSKLIEMQNLNLSNNNISVFNPLIKLKKITMLKIEGNNIKNDEELDILRSELKNVKIEKQKKFEVKHIFLFICLCIFSIIVIFVMTLYSDSMIILFFGFITILIIIEKMAPYFNYWYSSYKNYCNGYPEY